MLHSLYPTDDPALRRSVARAAARAGRPLVFTSLHIPESSGLRAFGAELAGLHRELGIEFCADVSPKALALLGVDLAGLGMLRDWGVTTVRIDFGFAPEEVRAIAAAGPFRIAVNASTVTPDDLDGLAGLDLIGWHNYYPRPETGLTEEFYTGQNALLRGRGHDVVTFIPGSATSARRCTSGCRRSNRTGTPTPTSITRGRWPPARTPQWPARRDGAAAARGVDRTTRAARRDRGAARLGPRGDAAPARRAAAPPAGRRRGLAPHRGHARRAIRRTRSTGRGAHGAACRWTSRPWGDTAARST